MYTYVYKWPNAAELPTPPTAVRIDPVPNRFRERFLKFLRPHTLILRTHVRIGIGIVDERPQPLLIDRSGMRQPRVLATEPKQRNSQNGDREDMPVNAHVGRNDTRDTA